MLRLNSKVLASARLNGKTAKVARLNGRVVWTAGIRSLYEPFTTYNRDVWREACDPADSRAFPMVSAGLLQAGIPPDLWSGKPAQSFYTRNEADNEVGTWTAKIGNSLGTAGLRSGFILGTDASASRMVEVVWERTQVLFRYRTSMTNPWINIGTASLSIAGGDTLRVRRYRSGGGYRVEFSQNGVVRKDWPDSSGIPGEDNGRFIGLRVQSDKSMFQNHQSMSIDEFTFVTG